MATFMKFRLVPAREEVSLFRQSCRSYPRANQGTLQKVDENDDWYGLRDAKERRKRQNRINQRAARRDTLSALPLI